MIKCIGYKKFESNFLKGFAEFEVELEGFKIKLQRCKVFNKQGTVWVNLPDHEYTNKNGEKAYAKDIKFSDYEDLKKFTELLKQAVVKYIKENPDSDQQNHDSKEVEQPARQPMKDLFSDLDGMF
jgi:hypothetical protein